MKRLLSQANLRSNYFDFLRFLAAALVIISHCYTLYGLDAKEPFYRIDGFARLGTIAVIIFFVISGFLIARSWLTGPSLISFFRKRVLRIFPALIIAVFVTVYVLGLSVTQTDRQTYLSHPWTSEYLYNATFYLVPFKSWLPAVFEMNPTRIVNGPLWTLSIEFFMYISVAVFGLLKLLKFRLAILAMTLGLIALDLAITSGAITKEFQFLYMPGPEIIRLGAYFFLGTLAYLYREKIPLNRRLALAMAILMVATFTTPLGRAMSYLAMPYLIIYVAFFPHQYSLTRFAKYGDFSYGLYIYAWPMQQVVMQYYGSRISLPVYIFLSFATTLPLAILSWHLVERWALKLKGKGSLPVVDNAY